jgi:hypothetical protein
MPSVSLVRVLLLVMSVLTLLSATVLDGLMMRYVVQPMLQLGERVGGAAVRPPGPMAFMLERPWARRLYNLLFAALLLTAWWYLGTAPGAARWAAMMVPPAR